MRLSISKSKNAISYYVKKDVVINGKRTTKIVEALGTEKELNAKLNGQDPETWARTYIKELNTLEKENNNDVIAKFSTSKQIPKNKQTSYDGGYLFLQDLYYDLGLNKICNTISKKYKFEYDLNDILSKLLYTRILSPSSKMASFEASKAFIEQPSFEQHDIYRALDVIAEEKSYIEAELYKNSKTVVDRNDSILYYDCTNYYFEIEKAEGMKQYGVSKEHRPNPIIQMGLFMDGNGIPLAFSLFDGNKNEQPSLIPLEKRIIKDFDCSQFIVCTDGGLSSHNNRLFNDKANRSFITTQSIKKLKKHLSDWALSPEGWHITGVKRTYNIDEIDEAKFTNQTFYKERWINEKGLEQRLIVTYSLKYKNYQTSIREKQVARAEKIAGKPSNLNHKNPNDPKRFLNEAHCTNDGEIAENHLVKMDYEQVKKESLYDGFYAVCTNLEGDVADIIKANHRRWEIEETFRFMKTDFKARPVYLTRENRIKAHFTTCFLSMVIFRILEKKLDNQFTGPQILKTLQDFRFMHLPGDGYVPTYTRTDITDKFHDVFNFRTDTQIVSEKNMKKIIKKTKS